MIAVFTQYIFLVLSVLALIMLANKIGLTYPVVLVIGGLGLSFIDRFSHIVVNPNVVFFFFLPPLIYESAWQLTWKEVWRWRRIVFSFAFPVVVITASVVALVSSTLIPGFTLAMGFLLGGIISPPDAVASSTIMRQVHAPKSLINIIEGESLLNDASSLIIFRFALAAVITQQFQLQNAATSFLLVVVMGTLIGLAVGIAFYGIHRLLPTTPHIEIILTLVTPYCMYYLAEHFHFSGVIAVVSGSLFLSSKRLNILSYQGRIQGINVWASLVFLLSGLIFLLIGLQLTSIVRQLENISLSSATFYGLVVTLTLIVTRLLCGLGASVVSRFMSRFISVADPSPGWKMPLVYGWAGIRGVVSLAAALSIPLLVDGRLPFPYRNLILFITFIVILTTLVLQGLTMPLLIRKMKLTDKYLMPEEAMEKIILENLAKSSIDFLEQRYEPLTRSNAHLMNVYEALKVDQTLLIRQSLEANRNQLHDFQHAYFDLLKHQRDWLIEMNMRPEFDGELIKKYITLVDLEELKLQEKLSHIGKAIN